MLAPNSRFNSLRELVQSYLSKLEDLEVDGIVVVVPSKKKIDVYSAQGVAIGKTPEDLMDLLWIVALEQDGVWLATPLDQNEIKSAIQSLSSLPSS